MVKTKMFLFHLHDSLYRCKHGGDQSFRSGQNIVEIKLSGLQFSFVVFFWVCIFFARVRQRTRCGFFHFQPMLGHGHVPGHPRGGVGAPVVLLRRTARPHRRGLRGAVVRAREGARLRSGGARLPRGAHRLRGAGAEGAAVRRRLRQGGLSTLIR